MNTLENRKKSNYKLITLNLDKKIVQFLEQLVTDYEFAASRSELIRICLRSAVPGLLRRVSEINAVLKEPDNFTMQEFEHHTEIEMGEEFYIVAKEVED